jgi:Calx-beta domain-containing protein
MMSRKVRLAVLLGVVAGILQMGREAVGVYAYLSVSVSDAAAIEPDSGSTAAQFIVTLNDHSRRTVTVRFSTRDGTARAPDDYLAAQGTVVFRPGETTHTLTIQVVGDTIDEPNETLFLNLSDSVNAYIADGTGVGTIHDNDRLPLILISDVTLTEGDSGTVPARFHVTLSAASGRSVSVDFATQNGTARAPSDYSTILGTLTFAPGETDKVVVVQVRGDTKPEQNEFFWVFLSAPDNGLIADGAGVGRIRDDDP